MGLGVFPTGCALRELGAAHGDGGWGRREIGGVRMEKTMGGEWKTDARENLVFFEALSTQCRVSGLGNR